MTLDSRTASVLRSSDSRVGQESGRRLPRRVAGAGRVAGEIVLPFRLPRGQPNDPAEIAGLFRAAFDGASRGVFEHVTFAVLDSTSGGRVVGPFRDAFEKAR
jgi:hypothetical protein